MSDFHFYEPRTGHGLPHDPFKAIVAPRPIAWVSTVDEQGRVNLAPYSFFGAFNESPPVVAFSSGGPKDSLRNIQATGEFVVNLVTRQLAEAMNITSASVPHGTDEMALAGLEPASCRLVRPPRVAASPAALECRALQLLPLKDLEDRPLRSTVVIGQVVGVHLDRACLKDGRFDMVAAGTVARCGYRGDYVHVASLFEMFRPPQAAEPGPGANPR